MSISDKLNTLFNNQIDILRNVSCKIFICFKSIEIFKLIRQIKKFLKIVCNKNEEKFIKYKFIEGKVFGKVRGISLKDTVGLMG